MDEIICRQKNTPEPMTGRRFVLGAAGIVLRLAVAQLLVNAAIALSGVGLLNVAFYLYAVILLIGFMKRTVASSVYTLGSSTLVLQSMLGDSTTSVVEIPLSRVQAVRPAGRCEKLRLSYHQVTAVDAQAKPGFRVRAAFYASLFSARLARLLAGKASGEQAGWVVVFPEEGLLRACVLRPDEAFLRALEEALPQAFDVDDRMTRARIHTISARALQRAFPKEYPHVEPLVDEEQMRWAQDELARQKQAREAERERKKARAQARQNAKSIPVSAPQKDAPGKKKKKPACKPARQDLPPDGIAAQAEDAPRQAQTPAEETDAQARRRRRRQETEEDDAIHDGPV